MNILNTKCSGQRLHRDQKCRRQRLSGTIHEEEVASTGPASFRSYVITHSRPRLEFLQSKEQLVLFTVEWRALLAEIRQFHGENAEVHLFPAIPCSVAVEIGRSLLPKVGPKLHI